MRDGDPNAARVLRTYLGQAAGGMPGKSTPV